MREILIGVLLASAALAGCMQDGEQIGAMDHDAPGNGTQEEADAGHAPSTNGSSEDGSSDDASSDGADQTQDNTTDDDPGTDEAANESDTASTPPASDPTPYNLTGNVSLGHAAAVGVEWTTPEQANGTVEDVEQTDAEHCPTAEFVVPASAGSLTIDIHNETVDPQAPGAGTYTIVVTPPEGEEIHLEWFMGPTAEENQTTWTTPAPTPGTWTLDAEPQGPVVQQTWRIDVTVTGDTVDPPSTLGATTTC